MKDRWIYLKSGASEELEKDTGHFFDEDKRDSRTDRLHSAAHSCSLLPNICFNESCRARHASSSWKEFWKNVHERNISAADWVEEADRNCKKKERKKERKRSQLDGTIYLRSKMPLACCTWQQQHKFHIKILHVALIRILLSLISAEIRIADPKWNGFSKFAIANWISDSEIRWIKKTFATCRQRGKEVHKKARTRNNF